MSIYLYLLSMANRLEITFFLILLLLTQLCSSQILRTKNWHFGYNTSLIFEKDTVLVDTSAIRTAESCASLSDINGNLLLYTDGVSVWNRQHQIVGNGSGLLGHESSSRGSVLLSINRDDSSIILFTTDSRGGSNGLRYHLIKMNSKDSFNISKKNILIKSNIAEPIAAINHQDNKRVWVLCREFNGFDYFSYLVTSEGIIDCPVTSKSAIFIGKSEPATAQNDIVISSDGRMLAQCYFALSKLELFKLNNQSGNLYDGFVLDDQWYPTGLSFSPNNEYLFLSERTRDIIQYKMSVFNKSYVLANNFHYPGLYYKFELQQTLQRKILSVRPDSISLDVIVNPNTYGSDLEIKIGGQSLGNQPQPVGLPNFNYSYFYTPSIDFSYDHNCRNNSYGFEATDTFQAREFIWRFNTSHKQFEKNGEKVQISLMDTGWWQVTLVGNGAYQSDSVTKNIYVYERIVEDFLGNDTSVCVGDSLTFELKTPKDMHCIHWMGQTGQDYENYHKESYKVDSNGTYTVKMTNKAFCTFYDTINVNLIPLPEKPVISYATGELAGTVKTAKYNWYLNDTFLLQTTERSILPLKNGYYRLQYINENGCEGPLSDSFWVGNVGMIPANPTDILIFPNPSNGEINIKVAESAKYDVDIFDIGGKLVFSESYDILDEKALRIDLLSGNYHLKVTYRNQYFLTKLVIQP